MMYLSHIDVSLFPLKKKKRKEKTRMERLPGGISILGQLSLKPACIPALLMTGQSALS